MKSMKVHENRPSISDLCSRVSSVLDLVPSPWGLGEGVLGRVHGSRLRVLSFGDREVPPNHSSNCSQGDHAELSDPRGLGTAPLAASRGHIASE